MNVGFDRENLIYLSVNPRQAGYSASQVKSYVDRLHEKLARLPGVVSASPIQFRLLSGSGNASLVAIVGRPFRLDLAFRNADAAAINHVGDGLIETLRIPLLAGRSFERRDMRPDSSAAVVDEVFASRFFPGRNALHQRFGFDTGHQERYEIVGIVRNVRYNSLRDKPTPSVFLPYATLETTGPVHFAIRAHLDSARLASSVRKAVMAVDPGVALTEFQTQTAIIDRLLRLERMLGFVSAVFGAIALALAAIGLGGLLAYAVARRTNEIGIRMALGAATSDVLRMIFRDSFRLLSVGILTGIPCAYVVGKTLEASLFEVKLLDPVTAACALVTLVGVMALAAWIPAWRASRIEPMTALREE